MVVFINFDIEKLMFEIEASTNPVMSDKGAFCLQSKKTREVET